MANCVDTIIQECNSLEISPCCSKESLETLNGIYIKQMELMAELDQKQPILYILYIGGLGLEDDEGDWCIKIGKTTIRNYNDRMRAHRRKWREYIIFHAFVFPIRFDQSELDFHKWMAKEQSEYALTITDETGTLGTECYSFDLDVVTLCWNWFAKNDS